MTNWVDHELAKPAPTDDRVECGNAIAPITTNNFVGADLADRLSIPPVRAKSKPALRMQPLACLRPF